MNPVLLRPQLDQRQNQNDDEKDDMKVMITVTTKPDIKNIDFRDIIYINIFNIRI